MILYCTSKNTGPTWTGPSGPDPVTAVYLGTSIEEAEEAVGEFSRYEKDESKFPTQFLEGYSAIPQQTPRELIRYFMADGWWYSIVRFEVD